jgi:tetratricopeptide (TPR) repeat protein
VLAPRRRGPPAQPGEAPRRDLRAEDVLTFAVAAGLVVLYAMRKGTYDLVDRGQLGVAVWWLLAVGLAFGWLPRARLSRGVALPLAGFAALVGWTALSFSWTQSDERTAVELARTIHHAGIFVLALSLVTSRSWRAAAAGVAAGGLIVCGFAVASRLSPGSFPADEVRRSFQIERLNYPLNYWNAIAAWGAVTAAMAVTWSAHATRAATRALVLALVPVAVLAVHWTYSRAGAVGLAIGAIASVALARNRILATVHLAAAAIACAIVIVIARLQPDMVHATGDNGSGQVLASLLVAGVVLAGFAVLTHRLGLDQRLRAPRRAARFAAATAGAAVVVAAAIAGPGLASDAYESFRNVQPDEQVGAARTQNAPSDPAARYTTLGGNRYDLWSAALDGWDDRPFKGSGPGTYEFVWNVKARDPEFVRDGHSLYLETLTELGIPGLVAVLAALGGALALGLAALRRLPDPAQRGALAAVLAGGLVFLFHAGVDWMWEATAVSVLGLALIALAAAPLLGQRSRRVRPPLRALAVLGALAACVAQLPPLVTATGLEASQRAAARGERGEALQRVDDAIEASPWAATPYTQRALLYERDGKLRSAAIDLGRAKEREPSNWRWPYLLSRIEAKRGLSPGAVQAYGVARELRPLASVFASRAK